MNTNVIVRITGKEQFDYWIQDASGNAINSGSAFHPDQYPDFSSSANVSLIVPGELITLVDIQLPKVAKAKWLKALPFALEEQLLDPVDELHLTPSEQQVGGTVTVAVVKKSLMRDWLTWCESLGVQLAQVVPDHLAITSLDNAWHIYLDGDNALIRQDRLHALTTDIVHVKEMLVLALNETEQKPENIIIDYDDGNEHFEIGQLKELPAPSQLSDSDTYALEMFAKGLAEQALAFNLLHGEFKVHRKASKTRRLWTVAVVLVGLLLLTYFASSITQWFVYQHRAHSAEKQVAKLYKQAFPQAQMVESPRLRVQQALSENTKSQSGGIFLGLVAQLGSQMKQSGQQVSIDNMSYQSGSLVVSVTSSDFKDISDIVNGLKQKGLEVTQQNASTNGGRVTARLTIQERASESAGE